MEFVWECFVSFLGPLGPILGCLERTWNVLESLGGFLAPPWGLLAELLKDLARLVGPLEVPSRRFSEPRAVLKRIWHSALDF